MRPHGPHIWPILTEPGKFLGKCHFPVGNFLVPNFLFPVFLPGNVPLYFRLTKSTAYSEENSVVVHFLHAVILKQNAGVGIHIGPGVLDLSGFSQDGWHDHVKLK